jgi:hypothetical protein
MLSTAKTLSAYVSVRQHTPAYASKRQHASAYASIRQKNAICMLHRNQCVWAQTPLQKLKTSREKKQN